MPAMLLTPTITSTNCDLLQNCTYMLGCHVVPGNKTKTNTKCATNVSKRKQGVSEISAKVISALLCLQSQEFVMSRLIPFYIHNSV